MAMMMRAVACALLWKLLRGLMSSCMTGLDDTYCSVQFIGYVCLWSVGHDNAPRANFLSYFRGNWVVLSSSFALLL